MRFFGSLKLLTYSKAKSELKRLYAHVNIPTFNVVKLVYYVLPVLPRISF